MAIVIFFVFVVFVIGLSLYLGNKTKTSSGYYAAGGKIHWAVNGIAFAGDYLSAASFLGICGMVSCIRLATWRAGLWRSSWWPNPSNG
jgi:cation/acetate symporter